MSTAPRPSDHEPSPDSPRASRVEMSQLVLPTHANAIGTVFGGQIMAWIDICAALSSMRHARMQCVTASMDAMDFLVPIRIGDVVRLQSMVNYVGRTSMEVGVRVEAGKPTAATLEHAASAYLTFVALGPDGKPTGVRPLVLESEKERLRAREAEARRANRLELAAARRRLQSAPAARDGQAKDGRLGDG